MVGAVSFICLTSAYTDLANRDAGFVEGPGDLMIPLFLHCPPPRLARPGSQYRGTIRPPLAVVRSVQGASDTEGHPVEDVQVDLSRADVLVAHELLDGSDVVAVLQQVSRASALRPTAPARTLP